MNLWDYQVETAGTGNYSKEHCCECQLHDGEVEYPDHMGPEANTRSENFVLAKLLDGFDVRILNVN